MNFSKTAFIHIKYKILRTDCQKNQIIRTINGVTRGFLNNRSIIMGHFKKWSSDAINGRNDLIFLTVRSKYYILFIYEKIF